MDPDGYLVFHHAEQRVFAAWENQGEAPAWLRTVCETWETSVIPPVEVKENWLPPESEWQPLLPAGIYADRVRALQRSIAAGDTYEACMTHAFTVKAEADALAVFRRLRLRNPAPYAAYLVFDDLRILSASPELFLELSSAGQLRSRPIKGTRPRGRTAESDAAWREELGRDPKDRAENLMIVDLTRHDFSRVCALGSVQVTSLFQVEAHPAVFQLVSEVRGQLEAERNFLEAVWACFPGGSMTGAPKERTVELLAACEAAPRGMFSGALGYFTRGRAFCLAMVIRTLENRGCSWRVGCGGAVLAESDPDAEWREALLKARSVMDAVGNAVAIPR
jgi:para-aminobenzoate synthetase